MEKTMRFSSHYKLMNALTDMLNITSERMLSSTMKDLASVAMHIGCSYPKFTEIKESVDKFSMIITIADNFIDATLEKFFYDNDFCNNPKYYRLTLTSDGFECELTEIEKSEIRK